MISGSIPTIGAGQCFLPDGREARDCARYGPRHAIPSEFVLNISVVLDWDSRTINIQSVFEETVLRLQISIALLLVADFGLHAVAQTSVRFAQLTDFHLLDAGYNCYGADVAKEYNENLKSATWAVDAINREHDRQALDFVVITGDLGLVNTVLPQKYSPPIAHPTRNACGHNTPETATFGPVSAKDIASAAKVISGILTKLEVKPIYLIPGNNDVPYNSVLKIEDPVNRDLYKAFIEALSTEMPGRIRDLSGMVTARSSAPQDVVRGYWLIGMDSSSFKPTDDELVTAAPTHIPESADPATWPDCLDPYPHGQVDAYREKELQRVVTVTATISGPFLLFTHIPDLQDPYKGRQLSQKNRCLFKSSWFLDFPAQGSWKDILMNPQLVAVFAGHFHSAETSDYGGPFRPATAPELQNIYVAPPLALKNQWNVEAKRGLSVVDVTAHSVKLANIWFPDGYRTESPQTPPLSPPIPNVKCEYLWPLAIAAIGIVVWEVSDHRRKSSTLHQRPRD